MPFIILELLFHLWYHNAEKPYLRTRFSKCYTNTELKDDPCNLSMKQETNTTRQGNKGGSQMIGVNMIDSSVGGSFGNV